MGGSPSIHSIFDRLTSFGQAHSKDETVIKYLARLRVKLKLNVPAVGTPSPATKPRAAVPPAT